MSDYSEQNRLNAERIYNTLSAMKCNPRRAGGFQCSSHCPFHEDDKPSLSLDMRQGVFYCHSCQSGGTVWDFEALLGSTSYSSFVKGGDPRKGKQRKNDNQRLVRALQRYNEIEPLPADKAEVLRCHDDTIRYWHDCLLSSKEARRMVTGKYEEAFVRSYYHWQTKERITTPHNYVSPRFTLETVRQFRIGYAPKSSIELTNMLRAKYSEEVIIGTGLVRRHGGSGLIASFAGRIIYPYLLQGKPCYAIARITPDSPTNLSDCKYLKQKTRDRKYSFPLRNPPLFNQDAIWTHQKILITEGVTDAIKACEAGVSAISPVTIAFINKHLDLIAHMLLGKDVVICNDNEENGAGEKGMRHMEEQLKKRGVDVRCMTLPRKAGQPKVDVCSFINDQGAEAFLAEIKSQTGIVFP